MSHEDETELYPAWKEALRTFNARGFTYGELIDRAWFVEAFGMKPLDENARYTPREIQHHELTFLSNITSLRGALLETREMDLVSDQRGGYLIIAPAQQAERAQRDMQRRIRSEVRKGLSRMRHVNAGLLSPEERQRHIDLLTKAMDLSFRLGFARRALPGEDGDEVE